jgi:hypothetical protein
MAMDRLAWSHGNAQANNILRNYDKTEFKKKYDATITNVLERLINEDVGMIISAIAETVKGIEPDESVDHSGYITASLMKKAMGATTSSVKYLFARRRQFHPDELKPGTVQIPFSAAKYLDEIIANMTAQDAAIFLGKLSGIYIKTCPKKLFRTWAEKRNMNPNTLFPTWTMEGELLMSIDF